MRNERVGRRAILQVRWGPLAFRKAVLEPGQALRVGRRAAEGFSLPHDAQMSDAHFELRWDGSTCRVRDLGSAQGTILGGQRIKESLALNGEWIRAGATDFGLYIEGATLAPDTNRLEMPELSASRLKAFELLEKQCDLFAVLDASRDSRILVLLQESIDECRSLYEGHQGSVLADTAPHIAQLSNKSRLLRSLIQEGWGKHWGIYFSCSASLSEARRHFRKFLLVKTEGLDGHLYFRFYDPRVLREFLPTCTAAQREEFFGPIKRLFHEYALSDREG